MLQAVRDYDAVKVSVENDKEELLPADVVFAILDGENPDQGLARGSRSDPAVIGQSGGD